MASRSKEAELSNAVTRGLLRQRISSTSAEFNLLDAPGIQAVAEIKSRPIHIPEEIHFKNMDTEISVFASDY
jgi:hypothetical protein